MKNQFRKNCQEKKQKVIFKNNVKIYYYIELILRVIMQYAEFTRYIRSRNLHAVNARCELLGITVTHELNYAMVIRGIHSN